MTQDDQVLAHVSAELTKTFRAAAQIGRWMSDRRREAQREAEMASRAQAAALRTVTEQERRLAEPVIRQAHDEGFWAKGQPQDAAYVYAVASRFATIDPAAAMAARRCEQEARQRWGLGLTPGDSTQVLTTPVDSEQVGTEVLEQVAPHLPGEPSRRWDEVLDQSAASDRQEIAQAQQDASSQGAALVGASAQQDRDEEMGRHEIGRVLDSHPQVARVTVSSVEALGADDQTREVANFSAYDQDGLLLEDASRALNAIVDRAMRPEVFVTRMAGRSYSRDDFEAETSRPLMRAAASLGAGAGVIRWDSQEARDQWASERRAEGIDPTAVRAARTGDMALARPAAQATAHGQSRTPAGSRPLRQAARSRHETLSM